MADLKFEIKKGIGVIGEGSRGWKKEVNIISWNDRKPKIDIRDWDETHERMGKGVTLDKNELIELKKLLQSLNLDELKLE